MFLFVLYYHCDQKPLEDDEVEMPDFKDGDLHDVLGEVVADSSDEENVSEDEVLFEV